MGVVEIRHADTNGANIVPGFLSTDNPGSLGGAYSSDIGRIITRSSDSNKYIFAIGSTANRTTSVQSTAPLLFGYLHSIEANPTTEGSTNRIYVRRFDANSEYSITFSTLYSTLLPATSDLGSYIGLGNTTTVAGCVLSMGNIGSSSPAAGTTSPRPFMVTGFDNNRRKIYVKPMISSAQFEW